MRSIRLAGTSRYLSREKHLVESPDLTAVYNPYYRIGLLKSYQTLIAGLFSIDSSRCRRLSIFHEIGYDNDTFANALKIAPMQKFLVDWLLLIGILWTSSTLAASGIMISAIESPAWMQQGDSKTALTTGNRIGCGRRFRNGNRQFFIGN